MKNYYLFGFSFLTLIVFCTCTSTNVVKSIVPHVYTYNENTEIEILGEIFLESKDRAGYIEILKAARNLYPDCHFVIDIMIDQILTTATKTTSYFLRRVETSETTALWIMRGTAVKYKEVGAFAALGAASPAANSSARYSAASSAAFPSSLVGTWKRAEYDNTLTFAKNSVKSSSNADSLNLIDVSADSYTLVRSDGRTFVINIKFANDDIEISGGAGTGQGNWNGTWRKQ